MDGYDNRFHHSNHLKWDHKNDALAQSGTSKKNIYIYIYIYVILNNFTLLWCCSLYSNRFIFIVKAIYMISIVAKGFKCTRTTTNLHTILKPGLCSGVSRDWRLGGPISGGFYFWWGRPRAGEKF